MRTLWTVGQVIAILALFVAIGACIDSFLAMPAAEVKPRFGGMPVGCDWVSQWGMAKTRLNSVRCSMVLPFEQDPLAFFMWLAVGIGALGYLWISSRPKRGCSFDIRRRSPGSDPGFPDSGTR